MILTNPNNPLPCTLHSHLAPHYHSLHLPSPLHSPTTEIPLQEICCSSPSPISWVTPLPSSNTLTCLIIHIKIKLLLLRDGDTSGKSATSTPAPSPSPVSWLPLGSHLGGQLGGEMLLPCAETEHSWDMRDGWLQAWEVREDAAGVPNDNSFFAAEALETTSK